MKDISRRQFLHTGIAAGSGTFALGFLGCSRLMTGSLSGFTVNRYGGFRTDPAGMLDLPPGFTYRAFSRTGELMDDGFLVPGGHDGMAAFPGPNGKTILVRNHELTTEKESGAFGEDNELITQAVNDKLYDRGQGTGDRCIGLSC